MSDAVEEFSAGASDQMDRLSESIEKLKAQNQALEKEIKEIKSLRETATW